MQRQRIRPRADSPPLMTLAVQMLAGVGRPQFAKALMAALQPLLPASHCTVFSLDAAGEVTSVSQASAYGDVATITAARYIDEGFYRRDANVRWLATRKPAAASQCWWLHQQADEIADATYRQACFGDTGIRERLALLLLQPEGGRYIINLYRNHALPAFTVADREQLAHLAPLVEASLLAHLRLTAGTLQDAHEGPGDAARHAQLLLPLSGREREVIAQVVAGLTTKQVAARLGLSVNTVLTYRYRAFRALGIRTQRELLARLGGHETKH